ncbi:MAG: Crp/Fnr family transcriptional regulator [Bacteroidetes bacterium]|nr:Crp/Fnr family transcriptional regulator [Bacteroidota bacterium]MBL0066228.1 Crp/Fnr family transcriptional regulator [Bacteroidota bacterium]MBL0139122.1 Crp/Fnr family transcriptional regulator [Bacteroidota bacterium]
MRYGDSKQVYFDKLSGRNSTRDKENIVNTIFKNNSLSKGCTDDQKNYIIAHMNCRNYRKGEVVFYENQPSYLIYFVESGIVKLWKEGLHKDGQIIRFAKEGDMMGFWGALENNNYSLTATAMTDSQLCFITRDIFLPVIKSDSALNSILHDYIKELKKTEDDLRNMAEMNVREKVAHSILILLDLFKNKLDEISLRVVLSRKEIAALSAICEDRVSKQLSDFRKERIIITNGKNTYIDKLALRKIISFSDYLDKIMN